MALRDVKDYLHKMQLQHYEAKHDLADFEQGLKDGYITEDRLAELKNNLEQLEINYNRLMYIDYLLELPNNKKSKVKAKKRDEKLEQYFESKSATKDDVIAENESLLKGIREEIKKLKK